MNLVPAFRVSMVSIFQRQKPVQGVQYVRNQHEKRQMIKTQTILSRLP